MFPRLENEKFISIDLETHDPGIKDLGCGARRSASYILGVGIASCDRQWYFPLNHKKVLDEGLFNSKTDEIETNYPEDKFYEWLQSLKSIPQIGANIIYDMDYLQYKGCIPARMHDCQIAEPLIDENKKSYSLESLAIEYLGEHKKTDELEAFCKRHKLKGKPQEHLAEMPVSLVGKYCKEDCRQTIEIWQKQMPKIKEQELERVYELECELVHVLLYMKKLGVRIDEEKLLKLEKVYGAKAKKIQKKLNELCGFEVSVNNENETLEKALKQFSIPYFLNDKNNPILDKPALKKTNTEFGSLVIDKRHVDKMLSTYITGMKQYIINGRIHANFNPLRNWEDKGTSIGRFSSSMPNLQNIVRNNEEEQSETGNAIRELFIPEEGKKWAKLDYKQQEIAIFFHFARGQGAEYLRNSYINNEDIDTYKIIAGAYYGKNPNDITKEERGKFKTITLGIMYGMAGDKLGRSMGLITLPEAPGAVKSYWDSVFSAKGSWEQKMQAGYEKVDFDDYPYLDQYVESWKKLNLIHKKLPCLKETTKAAQKVADERGYVRTILGRRRHFDNPQFTFKAFQSVDSGTGADLIKTAMCQIFRSGLLDIIDLHCTIHDELSFSYLDTKEGIDALKEAKHIMENAIKFKIPMRVDAETGDSWGTVKKGVIL